MTSCDVCSLRDALPDSSSERYHLCAVVATPTDTAAGHYIAYVRPTDNSLYSDFDWIAVDDLASRPRPLTKPLHDSLAGARIAAWLYVRKSGLRVVERPRIHPLEPPQVERPCRRPLEPLQVERPCSRP